MRWKMTIAVILSLSITSHSNEFEPDSNTVALWHFNETSGDQAFDSSANQNDGTILGAQPVDGKFYNALEFDGQNDFVTIEDQDNQTGMEQLSIEAWVWIDGPQGDHTKIIGKLGTDGVSDDSYSLETQADGHVFFIVSGAGGYLFLYTKDAVPQNQWVYLAAVYDGDSLRLYVNGELNSSGYLEQVTIRDTDEPILIGMNELIGDSAFFKGMIDEVRISKIARSASEISLHYFSFTDSILNADASDGVVEYSGVDNDDYVVILFGNPIDTSAWKINKNTIDSVLFLSNGHTWLSGFGTLGNVEWNTERTQLLITLSTSAGAPTIAGGDSITFNNQQIPITGNFGVPANTGNLSRKEQFPVKLNSSGTLLSVQLPDNNNISSIQFSLPNGKVLFTKEIAGSNRFDFNFSTLYSGLIIMKITSPNRIMSRLIHLTR